MLLFEGFSLEEVIDHTKQDFHVFLDLTRLEAPIQVFNRVRSTNSNQ